MPPVHHIVTGQGDPPLVFVHGFTCAHGDWDAQVAHLSARHQTIAVDLPGHGATPGTPSVCSIERYGAEVAEIMRAHDLRRVVLAGHSMGCRVVTEAALQAPDRTAAVIFVDASQFAPAMADILSTAFAEPDGFAALADRMFRDMFTAKSAPSVAAAALDRALGMPRAIGERVMLDVLRYDVGRFSSSLADLRVPALAIQSTYSNERRERQSLALGQTTPFLDMLRSRIPGVRIEIIPDTGHFPQIDEAARTNALIDGFLATLATR